MKHMKSIAGRSYRLIVLARWSQCAPTPWAHRILVGFTGVQDRQADTQITERAAFVAMCRMHAMSSK